MLLQRKNCKYLRTNNLPKVASSVKQKSTEKTNKLSAVTGLNVLWTEKSGDGKGDSGFQ